MRRALFPGTFDPLTLGHLDLIRRASALFDHLLVAVGENPRKHSLFSVEERLAALRRHTASIENVEIGSFGGLVVDYAISRDATVLVRGLRTASDFEFEITMALTNRSLQPDLEIVFLPPAHEYAFLSSSLIKEVISGGGDASRWLPPDVHDEVVAKLRG